MNNKIPMTSKGYEKLQAELKKLVNSDRPNIIAAISEARSHGDLSENAEYQYAKEQQSLIEGKIADLESIISYAEVIDVKSISGKEIKFGATIEIQDDKKGNISDDSIIQSNWLLHTDFNIKKNKKRGTFFNKGIQLKFDPLQKCKLINSYYSPQYGILENTQSVVSNFTKDINGTFYSKLIISNIS